MKKIFLITVGLAGVLFTSCDPVMEKGTFDSPLITAESLMDGATFAQFDAVTDNDGNVTYTPSEDGNYIQYNIPNVAAVEISYEKNGDKKVLTYGRSGGMFYYLPSRGSDPQQTLYFSYANNDGTQVVAQKQFKLKVAQALDPAVKVLVSNKGRKKWKWMPTSKENGAVWGNGKYCEGDQDGSLDIVGAWWGCGVEDGTANSKFSSQTNHTGGRYEEIKGECYALSYMEFNEDGTLTAYGPDGTKINEGSFVIKDYNKNEVTDKDKCSRGILETSAGAILWPFAINADGYQPTSFDIGWLDAGRMILWASSSGKPYEEGTWWSFMSDDDAEGILASHDWHWKPTEKNDGAVWGNGKYCEGSQDGTGVINGAWWGCGVIDGTCPDTFSGQMQNANMSVFNEGEVYAASKMVFNEEESTITLYDNNGKQIRQGSFSVDMTPNAETFSVGTLSTSEGAILWPFAINQNGFMPTKFDIGYLGSNALILIYGTKPYEEGTWWSFGK